MQGSPLTILAAFKLKYYMLMLSLKDVLLIISDILFIWVAAVPRLVYNFYIVPHGPVAGRLSTRYHQYLFKLPGSFGSQSNPGTMRAMSDRKNRNFVSRSW